MGWFELIALMKRVLPLLSRVAPMLETYLATRGATRGDGEALDRLSGEVKTHLATLSQSHADLKSALDTQNDRLLQISDELRQLRSADVANSIRLEYTEQQIASALRMLRAVSVLMVALLLACIGLLIALLLRH